MKGNKDHPLDANKALMNKALSYLSKFSSTENKLKTVLNSFSQKYLSSIKKDELANEIVFVIQKCKSFGYIDDEKFTKTKIEKYINLGKSKKNIVFNLKNYGINDLIIEKFIEEYFHLQKDNDFKAAIIFIRKKNIGPFFKRTLEHSILYSFLKEAKNRDIKTVRGRYIPTKKNHIVSKIYEEMGFILVRENEGSKIFEIDLEKYSIPNNPNIVLEKL